MRKKIAWGPDDIKGLFIKEDGESIPYTSMIRERINDHLIDACRNGHNLTLLCVHKKHSRNILVRVWINCIEYVFWTKADSGDVVLNKFFKKAISDFQKKWGEKLEKTELNKIETRYRFVMF